MSIILYFGNLKTYLYGYLIILSLTNVTMQIFRQFNGTLCKHRTCHLHSPSPTTSGQHPNAQISQTLKLQYGQIHAQPNKTYHLAHSTPFLHLQPMATTRNWHMLSPSLHVHEHHPQCHPNNPTKQGPMANTQTTPLSLFKKRHTFLMNACAHPRSPPPLEHNPCMAIPMHLH
jgi:hypothetical protein